MIIMFMPIRDRLQADLIAFTILALTILALPAAAGADIVAETFEPYADLLAEFVSEHDLPEDGLVTSFNYRAALEHAETSDRLTKQRQRLAEFDPDMLTDRDSTNAFWLNAYNFFMIAHIPH